MYSRFSLLLILGASQCIAQFSGAIQGTITDNSKAAVPEATVTATNAATGIVRTVKTSAEGFYRISNLSPGSYNLVVEKSGFAVSKLEGLEVDVTETVKSDFTLTVGTVSEQVQVKAEAPLLETEQGRISGQVDQMQLGEIPLNGRNSFNLIALQPGMVGRGQSVSMGSQGGGNDSFAGETEVVIYASGQRLQSNSYTIDDTSVNSVAYGGTVNTVPNSESVQEIRVVSNNFSAEDGRNSGARVQVTTKAGTNVFHGTLFYYNQNDAMTARNVFATTVPNIRKNQYGYAVGGPIFKNRTFFFTTFEGLQQSGSPAQTYTVETPQFRDIVVSQFPNSIAAYLFTHYKPAADPTFGFQNLGTPVPGGGPLSAGPPNGIPDIGNVNFQPDSFRHGKQFNGRIDHELRPGKDKIYATFYRTDLKSQAGGIRPEFNRPIDELTNFGNLNETHIFTPNLINEFRGGVSQLNGNEANTILSVPLINITGGVASFGIAEDSTIQNVPGNWWQTNWDFKDTFTWVRSKQTLKMGFELRKDVVGSGWASNYIPTYGFNSILDFAIDAPLTETRQVNPVTGTPNAPITHWHNYETAYFIQDDWKITRSLTLNLGLREENYGPFVDTQGARTLVLGPGSSYAEKLAGGILQKVPQLAPDRNFNFAPRLGFAWDPTGRGKMTIRGGYGIAYDRLYGGSNNYLNKATVNVGIQLGTPNFSYSLGSTACSGNGLQGGVGNCPPYLGYPVDPLFQKGLNAAGVINGTRTSITAVDPNFRSPYTHNWFLGVQRQMATNTIVEVDFLGSAAHHLVNTQNFNRFDGNLIGTGVFTGFNPYFSSMSIVESTSNSFYAGGTAIVRHAFSEGFNLQASYTFGKAIDDSDGTTGAFQDPWNREAERGLAGFDARQKFVASGVWNLPFFKGQSLLSRVAGGWELSGTTILQSGMPMNVTSTGAYPKGDWNADGTAGDRPDAPLTPLPTSGWSEHQFLTGIFPASSFPIPVLGTDGTLGRNTYRGPAFKQTDLALVKKFRMTERFTWTLRMDAYNAFNRVNLNNPTLVINAASFGQSTSALTARVYQAGLKLQF